jgi:hypothetical protein
MRVNSRLFLSFLGAIGRFVAMGIIGFFIGAIVLSVGYTLFLAWIEALHNPKSDANYGRNREQLFGVVAICSEWLYRLRSECVGTVSGHSTLMHFHVCRLWFDGPFGLGNHSARVSACNTVHFRHENLLCSRCSALVCLRRIIRSRPHADGWPNARQTNNSGQVQRMNQYRDCHSRASASALLK